MYQNFINNQYPKRNYTTSAVPTPFYAPIASSTTRNHSLHKISQNDNYHQSNNSQYNANKWNLVQNGQENGDNFPFGKECVKLTNFVTDQLKNSTDEYNKQMLNKFRFDAILDRNQRVMKHVGKIPYISQSMMPGPSVDALKLMQKFQSKNRKGRKRFLSISTPKYQPFIPVYPHPQTSTRIKNPHKIINRQSIGINANFEQQFPLKIKRKTKKRYYTIQQQQQIHAIDQIGKMLHDINIKLQKNNKILTKSMIKNHPLKKQISNEELIQLGKKITYSPKKKGYISETPSKSKYPPIQCSDIALAKAVSYLKLREKYDNSLKNYMTELNKKKHQMEDLVQYIYS